MMNFMDSEVLQPFTMSITPITELILFNFEQNPEAIYTALELQYLKTEQEGNGYRIIAYRNDQYVDVYDDKGLHIKEIGKFEVCQNGLKHYQKVDFQGLIFEMTNQGLHVAFSFKDYKDRKIELCIREHTKKKTKGFDLIAPIGSCSVNPVNFPAFAMYQFDLVRKKNTEFKLQINGKSIKLDDFPVPIPKDWQMRSFVRYSFDCELIEFGETKERIIKPEQSKENILFSQGLVAKYQPTIDFMQMESLRFEHSRHKFVLKFEDLFPDLLRMNEGEKIGRFKIEMEEAMGYFSGEYKVKKEKGKVEITMIPSGGWTVENKVFITKMMLQKKSIFRTWAKNYCYKQYIDLETGASSCSWKNVQNNSI